MLKCINFFGGPGTGKSTNATGLFYEMKKLRMNAEYVHEYAKDLVYDGRHNVLADQIYILAKQNRMLSRLEGKGVDYAITDSPLPTGLLYTPDSYFPSFRPLVQEVFNSYNNLNIVLTRNHPYDPIGRYQDEAGAIEVDRKLETLMESLGLNYVTMPSDDDVPARVLEMLANDRR